MIAKWFQKFVYISIFFKHVNMFIVVAWGENICHCKRWKEVLMETIMPLMFLFCFQKISIFIFLNSSGMYNCTYFDMIWISKLWQGHKDEGLERIFCKGWKPTLMEAIFELFSFVCAFTISFYLQYITILVKTFVQQLYIWCFIFVCTFTVSLSNTIFGTNIHIYVTFIFLMCHFCLPFLQFYSFNA